MKKEPRPVTPAEKVTVLVATLIASFFVLRTHYGYVLVPLMIVFFNGIVFLYDRQARKATA